MSTTVLPPNVERISRPGEPKLWTVEEYQAIIAAGVLRPDERVELLEGQIVKKMPRNPPHVVGILLLVEALRRIFGEGFLVNAQIPITTPDSLPEPDVIVLSGTARDFDQRLPSAERVVLLAEVANTSLK